MECIDNAREAVDANRRLLLVLRRGRVDSADTDIVDEFHRRGFRQRHGVDRQPDDCLRAQQPPRIRGRHVGLPDMGAVGIGGERHVDAIVDQERHVERRERCLDGTRGLDHRPGFAALVAQLHERRAAGGKHACQVRQGVAARVFGIDDGIKAKIDGHLSLPPPA